jgi:hypothetical protein
MRNGILTTLDEKSIREHSVKLLPKLWKDLQLVIIVNRE